jgi:hypothetical protein
MSSRIDHNTYISPVGVDAPYRNISEFVQDRDRMVVLADALDISLRNVSQNDCSQWTVAGKQGFLQTADERRYLLYIAAHSTRKWSAIKRKTRALGLEVTQDGDNEGCLRLGIPNETQAAFVRGLLGLRRRRRPSEVSAKSVVSEP